MRVNFELLHIVKAMRHRLWRQEKQLAVHNGLTVRWSVGLKQLRFVAIALTMPD